LRHVQTAGNYLREQLRRLSQRFSLGEVRGEGLLLALDIPAGNAERIAAEAFAAGLLINATRPTILRFMPALNVSIAEIDAMIESLAEVMARLRQ